MQGKREGRGEAAFAGDRASCATSATGDARASFDASGADADKTSVAGADTNKAGATGAGESKADATSADEGDKVTNYLTMLGHTCSDINQGALSAILPFLVAYNDYSYFQVAMLIFAANIASAVIQPLFGWIGDKKACPWFMALGVFLAGLGMFGVGYLPSYELIVASAMVSGIGVAMFHPEGGRLANLAAGKRKAGGMSIFAVGGNIGFFVGPLLAATFVGAFGLRGTLIFLAPATLCAGVLLAFNGRFMRLGKVAKAQESAEAHQADNWGRFGLLMVALSLRSVIDYGLMAFIPLFVMSVLGQGETVSSLMISLFAIFGALATVLSGRVSEKFGSYRTIVFGFALTAVFIFILACSKSLAVAIAMTVLLAITIDVFYPSAVALGMSYIPHHLGMASGLSYGVAVCMGGVAEPFLGMMGDAIGLEPVLATLSVAALIAAVLGGILWRMDKAISR